MLMRIKKSKTDSLRKWFTLRIGSTGSDVRAVTQFLCKRGNTPGPLFWSQDGSPLTRPPLTDWLRSTAVREGLKGNFSGHGFRIGAATTVVQLGTPVHLIKTLGRWGSNAYQTYIRTPAHVLEQVTSRIDNQDQ